MAIGQGGKGGADGRQSPYGDGAGGDGAGGSTSSGGRNVPTSVPQGGSYGSPGSPCDANRLKSRPQQVGDSGPDKDSIPAGGKNLQANPGPNAADAGADSGPQPAAKPYRL